VTARPHVCLATCAALPDLDEDERLLIPPLEKLGVRVSAAVWDDQSVDWDAFDLVVVRSTWDYTERRDEFVDWAHSVTRLANPADVIEWNTDKRYLRELEAAGLPIIPTAWIEPGSPILLPGPGEVVIKPSIGAGSVGVDRFRMDDPADAQRAQAHAHDLLEAGQTVLVQPYIDRVDTDGETGVVMLHGEYSHAVTKSAMLGAPRETVAGLYKAEVITPRQPSAAELELADRTMRSLRWPASDLLYARVDMLAEPDGTPILIELELTEPSLFMGKVSGSERGLAGAIVSALSYHG
jgi:glutathione synthase/RimK-type ligase-like ATP-grasp enzyme